MNTKSVLSVLALTIIAAACGNNEADLQNNDTQEVVYSFTARMPEKPQTGAGTPAQVATKSQMDENGVTTWDEGDLIAIWDAAQNEFCIFENKGDAGATATFSFSDPSGLERNFTRAISPASAAVGFDTVSLPDSYSLSEAGVARIFPMVATLENGQLSFKHLAAQMRVTLAMVPEEATSLEISAEGVSLSGDFAIVGNSVDDGKINAEGEGTSVEEVPDLVVKSGEMRGAGVEIQAGEGSAKVSVDISERQSRGVQVYIPLPVGAYSYTVSLSGSEGTIWTMNSPSVREVMRATLYRLTEVVVEGSPEKPFVIGSSQDLVWVSSAAAEDPLMLGLSYSLAADIDMSGAGELAPIGSAKAPFTGTFNGNGHTISNLTVASQENAGLFGSVAAGATVSNLTLTGAKVSAAQSGAGAVAGMLDGGTIEACKADAQTIVTAGQDCAGGIVGRIVSGTVKECAAHGTIAAGGNYAGGIVGYICPDESGLDALVINCLFGPVYSEGKMSAASVSALDSYLGGIAGAAAAPGALENTRIRIANCYAYPLELRATGTTVEYAAGILGGINGPVDVFNCITPITYSNVFAGETRLNAVNYGSYGKASCVVGYIDGGTPSILRAYSKNTWPGCYRLTSGVELTHGDISLRMGDGNMRGYSSVCYSDGHPISGAAQYTEADGGILKALSVGVEKWNASNVVKAIAWAYDPTFGYPMPAGIDFPGVRTKKVSLIGDSITTYQGYIFSTDLAQMGKHYPNTGGTDAEKKKWAPMVHNEQLTWWWRLIYDKMTDARLEVNNAWGGTTTSYVTVKTPNMPKDPTASCQKNSLQMRYLDYGLGNPDIVFSFGGRNDFGAVGGTSEDLLGDYGTESLQAAYDAPYGELFNNYSQGTVAILRDLHEKHPSTKVMLIITDLMSDGYEDAAQAITDFLTEKGFDIRFANLHKRGTYNKINDDINVIKEQGSHPNAVGCENVANYIWNQLGDWLDE